ncbi:hypothetical protein BDZ91DRAFT_732517 [Kalaharituber pfeilii]|nr:hypothetical protein BDZ91DRAFT_732517 [Kalaharituber pfeilii]
MSTDLLRTDESLVAKKLASLSHSSGAEERNHKEQVDRVMAECGVLIAAARRRDKWKKRALPQEIISTMYKRKKDKIRPLDRPSDGEGTRGDPRFMWKCEEQEEAAGLQHQKGLDSYITLKFSTIVRGSRLTRERLEKLNCGESGLRKWSYYTNYYTTRKPRSLLTGRKRD